MPLTPNIYFNSAPAVADDSPDHDLITQPALLQEGNSGFTNTGNSSDPYPVYISHSHDDEIYEMQIFIRDYDNANSNSAWGQGGNGARGKATGNADVVFPLSLGASADIRILLDGGVNQAETNVPLTNTIAAAPIADIATLITNLQSDIDAVFSPTAGGNTEIIVNNNGNTLILESAQFLDASEINLAPGDNNNSLADLGLDNADETKPDYANPTGGNAANAISQSALADLAELISWADGNISNLPGTGRGLFISFDEGETFRQFRTGFGDTLGNAMHFNGGDSFVVLLSALDVDTISWQSGNTIRYTLNGTPDLSTVEIGDKLTVTSAANASNNGTFSITAFDDTADWIEVYNASRTDATDDEASDSNAVADVERYNKILEFDYAGGDSNGEGVIQLQLSVPADETETGIREIDSVVQYVYN